MREAECEWCGRTFAAQRSTARLCSNACRVAIHRWRARLRTPEREDRYCEWCQAVIPGSERIDKLFCSSKCRQAHYRFMMPIDWGTPEMWEKIAARADGL